MSKAILLDWINTEVETQWDRWHLFTRNNMADGAQHCLGAIVALETVREKMRAMTD